MSSVRDLWLSAGREGIQYLMFSSVYNVTEPWVIVFLVPQVLQRECGTTAKSRSDKEPFASLTSWQPQRGRWDEGRSGDYHLQPHPATLILRSQPSGFILWVMILRSRLLAELYFRQPLLCVHNKCASPPPHPTPQKKKKLLKDMKRKRGKIPEETSVLFHATLASTAALWGWADDWEHQSNHVWDGCRGHPELRAANLVCLFEALISHSVRFFLEHGYFSGTVISAIPHQAPFWALSLLTEARQR